MGVEYLPPAVELDQDFFEMAFRSARYNGDIADTVFAAFLSMTDISGLARDARLELLAGLLTDPDVLADWEAVGQMARANKETKP